eukprot:symbB.v1.2.028891.t1/scaffold3107.1/size63424/3
MGGCNAAGSPDVPVVKEEVKSTPSITKMKEEGSELPKQEKLRENHALQRPRAEVVVQQRSDGFQAKSEAEAEKRRLAERKERLLLKADDHGEALPEEKLRDPQYHSRMEAAEASHAAKEKAASAGRHATKAEEKLQDRCVLPNFQIVVSIW